MAAWTPNACLAVLLLLGACSNGSGPPAAHTVGTVPRDARGDPVFAAIGPAPPEPVIVPMPAAATAALPPLAFPAATTVSQPAPIAPASGPVNAPAVVIPTDPSQLPPPAKPVSCRHFKRCA